ncbi:MAG: DUF1611 domain-containing protein [Rhodobacterales bacterium]|nr:DUF1611 domain-containing protein [Rhodobacterales bacterium]
MKLERPYVLFLGDAPDNLAAKLANGIVQWRRDWCIGQIRLDSCQAQLDLPVLSVEEAVAQGAKTLVIGVANAGGLIAESWLPTLRTALESGLDLASGMHQRLSDVPVLAAAADFHGRLMHDVRHPDRSFAVGTGDPRPGKRVLAVGTDCSVGKMYAALAIEREMRDRGWKAHFRATGQTGILIAGDGVSVDAVVSDFVSGATEWLTPANDTDHWDVVEGQGSLFHPSFAGVSLGLLHGSQPDALVMCHEPTRTHMRGLPRRTPPDIADCIQANEYMARMVNPYARVVGLAINTSALSDDPARRYLKDLEDRLGLPAVDPVRTGVAPIVDRLAEI